MPRYHWTDDGYFVTERRDLGVIKRVLILTMLLNFLAMAIKLAAGLVSGSLSMVADGLDSLFDGLSNVVGLGGLYIAGKPPDAEHPYGHRKFETIAALSISFLLFLTCVQLIQSAWQRLNQGIELEVNLWTITAMVLSMLIQGGTSLYELRAGRRLKSEILIADALHTRASILISFSVLAGLGFVRLGYPQADPILAAFVAVMIAKIGIDILRETVPVLVDQAAVDPQKIAELVTKVGGVESFHRVRSRGAEGSAAVDLHVRVSPDKTVQEADAIAHEVRRRLLALDEVTDVTVHMEAQRLSSSDGVDLYAGIKLAADELGVTIHESWVYRTDGNLHIEIHVGVEPWLTLGEAHDLVDHLERNLLSRFPEVREVHTHIEMATKQVIEGDRVPADLEKRVEREIEDAVATMPSLSNPHNIIVRWNTNERDKYSVSLECTVAAELPIADAHQLSTNLERELNRRLKGVVDVLVHLEPPEQVES